ncbi:uncharacterized protein PITG_00767 [Phytophthora infestans T30-4]|uniref:Uncharacterized protein n=1 Tax=Phytophthora infestans (strain T30-4) TaxID=403677 RepID=D0MRN3_PHYIT|nr:uncharacterized protein PITG_00767 [Phytophthora infestans T30-4]EEY58152.1 conserved hypothetical protein [Phytophthora infestans T30-4]|eukprot:XP_002909338.1 conserved hypothetical protein [Phytophthora infestans T30-4]
MVCLASIVYHIPFLRTHLPPCHPHFETALFQDAELIKSLMERVHCGFSGPDSKLKATGLPPHVTILSPDIVKDIVHELEDRAIGARTVTYDGLHDALRNCLAGRAAPPTFFWAGKFRRVPPDFVLPECSIAHLWVIWRSVLTCQTETVKSDSVMLDI